MGRIWSEEEAYKSAGHRSLLVCQGERINVSLYIPLFAINLAKVSVGGERSEFM
jgi:hypothetical protein